MLNVIPLINQREMQADDFLGAFDLLPFHLFRAIHPISKKSKTVGYGTHEQYSFELQRLNAAGYSIYFIANNTHGAWGLIEPKNAKPYEGFLTGKSAIRELRCIYQDADDPKTASVEQLIAGQPAHAVVETSPGKFQRVWLTEPLPVDYADIIHTFMVEWHAHDHQAEGPQRLLRVPGYANTKYPERPVARLQRLNMSLPLLTLERVKKHFGIGAAGDHGVMTTLDVLQGDGGHKRRLQLELRETREESIRFADILDDLARLDPDMDRGEWRKVIGALHYPSQAAEWGKRAADRWSSLAKDPKKYDAGSFEHHWHGLDVNHPKPTALGTLKLMAAEAEENAQLDGTIDALNALVAERRAALQPLLDEFGPFVKCLVLISPEGEKQRPRIRFPFIDTQTGKPFVTNVHNAVEVFRHYGKALRFNEFTRRAEVDGIPLDDNELIGAQGLAHANHLTASMLTIKSAAYLDARENPYHPVKDEFDACKAEWDGKERLKTFAKTYLGAQDTPLNRELGVLMFVGLHRRIRQPGYKCDLMPILDGPQDIGKSLVFSTMALRDEWFTDNVKVGMDAKEVAEQTAGKLVVECAELVGMRGDREVERIKTFVSRRSDDARKSYGYERSDAPRQFMVFGTNNRDRYLADDTGNRRFPAIDCGVIDHMALRRDIRQLHGEAAHEEETFGWLELSQELKQAARELAETKRLISAVEEMTQQLLSDFEHGKILISDIWNYAGLRNDPPQFHKETIGRIARDLGWERKQKRKGAIRPMCYVKGTEEQTSDAGRWVTAGIDRDGRRFARYEDERIDERIAELEDALNNAKRSKELRVEDLLG